ncbi:hypothetical protein V2J09_015268 [Rumex salicifolius]
MKGRTKKRIASYISPSSSTSSGEEDEIVVRKGPWKAEEDEVLLKHVKKYGPRDWSSLLSKRLLQRTGKSCRLRWVNKLRPNLKNGCKFSAEEERVVIELQAQLGNKWAKIATYLPGRTDNDVKNFWSSRQKRLARLLHNSQHQNAKSNSNKTYLDPESDPPEIESCSKDPLDCTPIQMVVPLHTMIEPNNAFEPPPINASSSTNQVVSTCISLIPEDQQDLPFLEPSNAHEEPIGDLDLDFMGAFPNTNGAIDDQELINLSTEMASYLEPLQGIGFSGQQQLELDGEQGERNDHLFDQNPLTPDRFFDDLPPDIFDQMEPLPSPPSDY